MPLLSFTRVLQVDTIKQLLFKILSYIPYITEKIGQVLKIILLAQLGESSL